jgi:hypothetical protein
LISLSKKEMGLLTMRSGVFAAAAGDFFAMAAL